MSSVVVIGPHPDDESIGCGGAICLHRRRGDRVRVVFLTSGERGIEKVDEEPARTIREAEAADALGVLGVEESSFLRLPDLGVLDFLARGAEQLGELLARDHPEIIYLPHPEESHPDHQAALPLVRAALAPLLGAGRPRLYLYEVWTPMTAYDWPQDIGAVMSRKLQAVRCYRSQLSAFRYDRAVQGLNRYRGCLAARCRYAEVFRYADPAGG
jgi:LmbE family N-acetylglucosaminyl deacetylase